VGHLFLLALIVGLTSSPGYGQEIRYIETERPALLNPVDGSRNIIGIRILSLIFRGMLGQDRVGKWVPEMALKPPVYNEETNEMVVKLIDGLLWPDGQPITAADVVHSFRTYLDKRSVYGNVNTFENIEDIMAVGDNMVSIKLKKEVSWSRLGFHVMPKHKIGDDTYIANDNVFNLEPMGSGPYKITSLDENSIEFELNEKYYKPPPEVEFITMEANPDEDIQKSLLLYGETDLDPIVRPRDLSIYGPNTDIEVEPYDSQTWYGFAYNCKRGILKYREVRQAFTLAYNREEPLKSVFAERGKQISGPFTISSPFFNTDVPVYPYDPLAAGEMLNEIGFVDSDGDGLRDLNGEPVKLKMVLSKGMSEDNKVVCAGFVQQLKAKQIDVTVDWYGQRVWNEKVFMEHDYDIAFVSWKFDDGTNIYPLFSKTEQSPGLYNIVQYENDEIQEFLERFRESEDITERTEIGKRLHALLQRESPYTFLWTLEHSSAYRLDVIKKIRLHSFYFFSYIDQWKLY
jgi:peptide/nickel transport system substrate-binding protein